MELAGKDFKTNKKWSNRVKSCFLSQGKPWNDSIEKEVKETVARLITGDIVKEIGANATFLHALVSAIEEMI